jgi:pyroglutamyl-peptidase
MIALVAGFEPFDGDNTNASLEAVRALPARVTHLNIVKAELPTSFRRALPALRAAIARVKPDIVLCVGQAGDRYVLSVERIAVNLCDARIADNDSAQPRDKPVIRGGPAAYFATLPVKQIVVALQAQQLPAEISMSAGTFVCNQVFYGLMHAAAKSKHRFRAGFVHVPALPLRTAIGAMTLDQMVRGIEIVLRVAATTKT